MTSRVRLLLSWIEAAVPGEGASRIIRRDIQGDTERGYAERGRQHQQFPLVEIEHRASNLWPEQAAAALLAQQQRKHKQLVKYRPAQEGGIERHASRALLEIPPPLTLRV